MLSGFKLSHLRPPQLRSVRASFLAINVPLVLLAMAGLFFVFEYTAYNRSLQDLEEKLHRSLDNQSTVMAESVWNLDQERIQLILEATAKDPDILGAAVYDDMDNLLSSVGTLAEVGNDRLTAGQPITFGTATNVESIGHLIITLTDERVRVALNQRIQLSVALAVLLLLSVVVSALVANRWTIGIPLQRLLESIDRTETGGVRHAVRWESQDEIGAVVKAFNRMQARQQRYDAELRRARENLERRVAERTEELARARDSAEAANKAKTGFLANMSHELRTPLNAIIGFAEVLEGEVMGKLGNHKYHDYAKDIRESGQHLLSLINDLLDLSKAEAGKLELYEVEMDLQGAIKQSIAMVQSRASANSIAMTCVAPDDLPGIYADERKIKQVLLNLLTNAVKFTPEGGEVAVEVSCNTTQLGFTVRDSGIGIDERDLAKVMEPFAQVDSSLNRKYDGTGLGLPLVKSLVELHGGNMEIRSEPGHGTRVAVTLPPSRLRPFPPEAGATVDAERYAS
jgi:signal transduction histidine kinase